MVVSESYWEKTILFLIAKSQVSFAILLCVLCMCALYMYRVFGHRNVCQDRRLTSDSLIISSLLSFEAGTLTELRACPFGWTDWPASLWISPSLLPFLAAFWGYRQVLPHPALLWVLGIQVQVLMPYPLSHLSIFIRCMHSKNYIVVYIWPVSQILTSACTRYIVSLSPQYTPFLEKRFMVNATGKINYFHLMPVWQVGN